MCKKVYTFDFFLASFTVDLNVIFFFYILLPENETIFGEWLIDRTNCKYIYDKQGRAALSTVLIFFYPGHGLWP